MKLHWHATMVAAICTSALAPHPAAADPVSPNKATVTVKVVDSDRQHCESAAAQPLTAQPMSPPPASGLARGLAVSLCMLGRPCRDESAPGASCAADSCTAKGADQNVTVEIAVDTEEDFALSLSSIPPIGNCRLSTTAPAGASARPASSAVESPVLTVEF